MRMTALAPLAVALLALAACGQQDGAGNGGAPAGAIAGKAPPAGTTWAQQVVATPEGGFRMGNPDAPIKLIEFGSYTCPHCKDFTQKAHASLESAYVNSGKVSFEYRNFIRDPLDLTVALLARCGGPAPFFPLNEQFFAYQEGMIQAIQAAGEGGYQSAISAPPAERFVKLAELAGLIEYAKQRGIAEDKARACLADVKTAETLTQAVERATQQYNITGTPTVVMNGSTLENVTSWETLVERLKQEGI